MYHLKYPNGKTEGPYGSLDGATTDANTLLSESVPFINIVNQDGWIVGTVGVEATDKSKNVPNAADKGKEYSTAKNRMGSDELVTKVGKSKKHVLNELPIINPKDGRTGGRRGKLADAGLDLAITGDETSLPDTHTESKHPSPGQRLTQMTRRKRNINETVQDFKGVSGEYMVGMNNMAFDLGQNSKMTNTGGQFEEAGESTHGEPDDGIQTKGDATSKLGQNNKIKNKGGSWESEKEPGTAEPNDGIQKPHKGNMAKELGQNSQQKNKGGQWETLSGPKYGNVNETWSPSNIANLMEGEDINLQQLFNEFARGSNVISRVDFEEVCRHHNGGASIPQPLFESLLDNNSEFIFHENQDYQGLFYTKEYVNEGVGGMVGSAAGAAAGGPMGAMTGKSLGDSADDMMSNEEEDMDMGMDESLAGMAGAAAGSLAGPAGAAAGGAAGDMMSGEEEEMDEDMYPPDDEHADQASYQANMGMADGYEDDAMGMQPGHDFQGGPGQEQGPGMMGQDPMGGMNSAGMPGMPPGGGLPQMGGLPPEARNGVMDFNVTGIANSMGDGELDGFMGNGMGGGAGSMGGGCACPACGGSGMAQGEGEGGEEFGGGGGEYGGGEEEVDECDSGCQMGEDNRPEMGMPGDNMPGQPGGGRSTQGQHDQMGSGAGPRPSKPGAHRFGSDAGQFGGGSHDVGGDGDDEDMEETMDKMGMQHGAMENRRRRGGTIRETHEMGMRGEEHASANKNGIYTTDDTTDNGLRGQGDRTNTTKPFSNKVPEQMTYESAGGDASDGIQTEMDMADDLGQNDKIKNKGSSNQAMKGDSSKLHENVRRLNKVVKEAICHFAKQFPPRNSYSMRFVVACEGIKARSRNQLAEALTDVEELMQAYGAKLPVLHVQYHKKDGGLMSKQAIRFDETVVVARGPVVSEGKVIFRYAEVANDFADQVVNEGKKCRLYDHNWGAAVTGKFNYGVAVKAFKNIPAVLHS